MSSGNSGKACCSICGIETSTPEFFKSERRSFSSRVLKYCPQCWAQRQTRSQRNRLRWWLALTGAGLFVVGFFPGNSLGWALLNLAWLDACFMLAIAPHEFAHAFTARVLGYRVFRVFLGSGRVWWRGRIFGFAVEARRFPFDGAVVAAPREPRGLRWKQFLFILAGPLANTALLALALAALGSQPWWIGLSHGFAGWQIFAAANLLIVLTSLWPHEVQTALGPLPSDGRLLLQTLFGWKENSSQQQHAAWFLLESADCLERRHPEESRAWVERGLAEYPDNPLLRQQLASLSIEAGELEAARNILLPLLAEHPAPDATRLTLLNNIAYIDALLGQADLLEEADRYSSEALAAIPWSPALQNTRGVVLLALDRLDEALPLLRTSAESEREHADHTAQCQSVLAIAEARQGELAAAERALEAARLAAPQCFLIPRAEAALQAAREQAGVSPPNILSETRTSSSASRPS